MNVVKSILFAQNSVYSVVVHFGVPYRSCEYSSFPFYVLLLFYVFRVVYSNLSSYLLILHFSVSHVSSGS